MKILDGARAQTGSQMFDYYRAKCIVHLLLLKSPWLRSIKA